MMPASGAWPLALTPIPPIQEKWQKAGGAGKLGVPTQPTQYLSDGVGAYQEFQNGVIFYSRAYGAVLISRSIYEKWKSPSVATAQTATGDIVRDYMGYPTLDYFTTPEGGSAAYFERGMIVLRANHQACVVYGLIYGHYRQLGDISGSTGMPVVGMPVSDEETTSQNGRRSRFDSGDIYWTGASGAWEIHGPIRDRWLSIGAVDSSLGFPISDESPVLVASKEVGKFSRFSGGSIFWTAATGAWELSGPIQDEWQKHNGPAGPLGFPVSGNTEIANIGALVGGIVGNAGGATGNSPPGQFANFEHGVIVWYPDGEYAGVTTVTDLQLFLERYDCNDDFNVQLNITATPSDPPNTNHGRMPADGNYDGGGKNLDTVLLTVPVVQGNTVVDVWMECISEDTLGKDDREGTVTASYSILNLWGLRESGHDHPDGAFTASFGMQPKTQIVSLDPSQFRYQLFWPFHNFKTFKLSWRQYSETFNDVSETDKSVDLNPFDFKLHLFEILFYESVYNSFAQSGNCFGMCLESIYARDHRSLFFEPIFSSNSYRKDGCPPSTPPEPNDAEVCDEINIKHGYQLGSCFIQWFLGKWTAGALHDPIRAFKESHGAFRSGDWPLLSISDKDKFSQHGHAVVPYFWDDNDPYTWRIYVANPKYPPPPCLATGAPGYDDEDIHNIIFIDLQGQSFRFKFDDGPPWTGSLSDGGRLLSVPYSQLRGQPVTPGNLVFDLLSAGTLIVLADDGETRQITDEAGRTFYTAGSEGSGTSGRIAVAGGFQTGPPTKKINEDARSRIPGMALIPAHGSPVVSPIAPIDLPPETYFVQRPESLMKMVPSPTQSGAITPATDPRKTVGRVGVFAGGTPPKKIAPLGAADAPIGAVEVLEPSLAFDVTGKRSGTYTWSIFGPSMSASVYSTCSAGLIDTIVVNSVTRATQFVSVTASPYGSDKVLNLAVGGPSAVELSKRKWYEVINLNVVPGQTVTAHVNNGGKGLLLENAGSAATFELRIHYGIDGGSIAIRQNVVLESDSTVQITPVQWDAATMTTVAIKKVVVDRLGASQIQEL